jgi:hypothetical protein
MEYKHYPYLNKQFFKHEFLYILKKTLVRGSFLKGWPDKNKYEIKNYLKKSRSKERDFFRSLP